MARSYGDDSKVGATSVAIPMILFHSHKGESMLQRNPDIVWRVEKRREAEVLAAMERGEDVSEHGTVILIISGMMHQLNFVGARIWSLCDGTRSEGDLVALLATEFEVDAAELTSDVHEFINELVIKGWLQRG